MIVMDFGDGNTEIVAPGKPSPDNLQTALDSGAEEEPVGTKCEDNECKNNSSDCDEYFTSYEDLEVHRLMVGDRARTEAYRSAIMENKHLFQDKVVIDVGAGTGILSLFAAEAGARRVYAVEASSLASLARDTVRQNGRSNVVEVIHSRVEELQLDAKVDVIVSEWMGFYLLHESMLASVIVARDRFLRDGGTMFPSIARLYACPSSLETFFSNHLACWHRPYGLDMTPVADAARRSMQIAPQVLETMPAELLAVPEQLLELDLSWTSCDDLETIRARRFVTVTRDGVYRGLCLWFSCEFPGGRLLDTAPAAALTHWKQTGVMLPRDFDVSADEVIGYEVTLARAGRRYTIALEMLDEQAEHPVPCGCARGKCRLIKALIDKEDADFENAGD